MITVRDGRTLALRRAVIRRMWLGQDAGGKDIETKPKDRGTKSTTQRSNKMKITIKKTKNKEKKLFSMEYGEVFYVGDSRMPAILINPKEIGVDHCKPGTKGLTTTVFDTDKWLKKKLSLAVCFVESGNVQILERDTEVFPLPDSKLIIRE